MSLLAFCSADPTRRRGRRLFSDVSPPLASVRLVLLLVP
jgi:hypothetical protein